MEVSIKMLNVGDGDSLLVKLTKQKESLIMVVDGGKKHCYQSIVKPALLELLSSVGKEAPDIVICTHYDADHIGGLIPLVKEFGNGIKEVWVHDHFNLAPDEWERINEWKKYIPQFDKWKEREIFLKSFSQPELAKSEMRFVLESIQQLQDLVNIIPPGKRVKPFPAHTIEGWNEIEILGPTTEYYDSLFPRQTLTEILNEQLNIIEVCQINESKRFGLRMDGLVEVEPCTKLRNKIPDRITPQNKASIIFSITDDQNKYLFTGDADVDSFKNIKGWPQKLKNLYWLKIPHHGSENNLDPDMIDLMRPKYADCSGSRHQDDHVLKCIETHAWNTRTRSTKTLGHLTFPLLE